MITIENPDEIYKYDLKTLYSILKTVDADVLFKYKDQIDLIEQGFLIKTPIYLFTENFIKIFPDMNIATYQGYGKYKLVKHYEEQQAREQAIKKIIFELIDKEEIVVGR